MANIKYNSAFSSEISKLSAAANNINGRSMSGGLLFNKVVHVEHTTDLPAFLKYIEDHIYLAMAFNDLQNLLAKDIKNLNDTMSTMSAVDNKNAKAMKSIR